MKFRKYFICLIFILCLFLQSCKKEHVHEYENGYCECGERENNNNGAVIVPPQSGNNDKENIDLELLIKVISPEKYNGCSANFEIRNDIIKLSTLTTEKESLIGWYLDEDCQESNLLSNESRFEISVLDFVNLLDDFDENETVTIYARFGKIHSITYDYDGGIPGEKLLSSFYEEKSYKLSSNITKEGYNFLGWYYNDTKIDEIPEGTKTDLVLTAKWEIKFEANSLVNTVWEYRFKYNYNEKNEVFSPLSIIIKFRDEQYVDIYYYFNGYHVNLGNVIDEDIYNTYYIFENTDINYCKQFEEFINPISVTEQKNYFVYSKRNDNIYIYLNKDVFLMPQLTYNLYGREPIMISTIVGNSLEISRFTLVESTEAVDSNNNEYSVSNLIDGLKTQNIYKNYTPYDFKLYASLISNSQSNYQIKNINEFDNNELKGKMFKYQGNDYSNIIYISESGYYINLTTEDFKTFYFEGSCFKTYFIDQKITYLDTTLPFTLENEKEFPDISYALGLLRDHGVKFLTNFSAIHADYDLVGNVLYMIFYSESESLEMIDIDLKDVTLYLGE